MSEFSASNGVGIELRQTENGLDVVSVSMGSLTELVIGPLRVQALREFFRAEEDERLGRWRWPENPDYVVYRDTERMYINQPAVIVFNETNGATAYCGKDGLYSTSGIGARDVWCEPAARAYFDAHPEPKPSWHDAKHGEIWVLFVAIKDEPYRVNGDVFEPVSNPGRIRIPLMDARIQSGRRIYPEDTE